MTDRIKAIGSISKYHAGISGGQEWRPKEPWCTEVLLYSPKNPGDNPERRVMLYMIDESVPVPPLPPLPPTEYVIGIPSDGYSQDFLSYSRKAWDDDQMEKYAAEAVADKDLEIARLKGELAHTKNLLQDWKLRVSTAMHQLDKGLKDDV